MPSSMVFRTSSTLAMAIAVAISANAQQSARHTQRASDSATESSPVSDLNQHARTVDGSTPANTAVSPQSANQDIQLKMGTPIRVALTETASSASAKNGAMLNAVLKQSLSDGNTLIPAGSPVQVEIIESAVAGKLQSRGELSLQVVKVGSVSVLSNVQTFFGEEGHKDLPDSAPGKGTEATVATNKELSFSVAPHNLAELDAMRKANGVEEAGANPSSTSIPGGPTAASGAR